MAAKAHGKKKAGRKAGKKKAAKASKTAGAADAVDSGLSEPNPRAGQLASKGRARVARARTAEREQRRLHGAAALPRCSERCGAQLHISSASALPAHACTPTTLSRVAAATIACTL